MDKRLAYGGLILIFALFYSWGFQMGSRGYGYAGYHGYYHRGPSFWYFGGPRYSYPGDRSMRSGSLKGTSRHSGGGIKAGK